MNPKPKKGAYQAARKAERKRSTFELRYGSSAYVDAVTRHPCLVEQRNGKSLTDRCVYMHGRSEAAHLIKKTHAAEDERATWRGIVPLCSQHHAKQEGGDPEVRFMGIDLVAEAALIVDVYGHLVPTLD